MAFILSPATSPLHPRPLNLDVECADECVVRLRFKILIVFERKEAILKTTDLWSCLHCPNSEAQRLMKSRHPPFWDTPYFVLQNPFPHGSEGFLVTRDENWRATSRLAPLQQASAHTDKNKPQNPNFSQNFGFSFTTMAQPEFPGKKRVLITDACPYGSSGWKNNRDEPAQPGFSKEKLCWAGSTLFWKN